MVKLSLKTVQNKLFNIEVEDDETIAQLKSKIQESQGFQAELQKIIYSGKILADASTVGSYKIKEKDFLVVMVSKAKAPVAAPTPAASEPAAASSSSSTPAPAAPAATDSSSAAAPMDTDTPAAAPEQPQGLQGGSFVSGPALQSAISGMVEMGFERDQVMRALKASFNNPDRAVEYLMNGDIPEIESSAPAPAAQAPAAATPARVQAPATSPAAAATPAAAPAAPAAGGGSDNLFAAAEAAMNRDRGGGAAVAGAGAGGAASGGDEFAALAASPVVQQLRAMVQENPALIGPLIQQIATTNPQLAQLINQNPQALYELLGIADDEEGDEGEYPGQEVMQVNLTQDEAAAVERLEQLGFERQMVLQAYMLCDKNEELAANFLFEAAEDEQQQQGQQ